jgi:hypothetical protein
VRVHRVTNLVIHVHTIAAGPWIPLVLYALRSSADVRMRSGEMYGST